MLRNRVQRSIGVAWCCFLLPCIVPMLSLGADEAVPDPQEAIRGELDAYMEARARLGHFNGSVLVARDGRPLLSRGYGFADFFNGVLAGPDTVYRIASITKPFTAECVLILRDRGRLNLDDPLSKYVEGAPPAWKKVRIHDLLRHTSGIPDYEANLELGSPAYTEFMGKPDVPSRIEEWAKSKPLDFEPGSEFRYSNTGYVLLGRVIEQASGKPFDTFLTETILKPLGMNSTRHDREGVLVPERAIGFQLRNPFTLQQYLGGFQLPRDLRVAPDMWMTPPRADCGLITCATDLWRWDQSFNRDALLAPGTIEEIFTPGRDGYGFGWHIEGAPGKRIAYHTGVLPGFVSRIIRFLDEHLTIILLGNTELSLDRIAADLTGILRREPVQMPVRRTIINLNPEQVRPLLGSYADDQNRVLRVEHDGDMVTVGLEGKFVAGLLAESDTRFFGVMFNGPVIFEIGEDGRAEVIDILLRGQHWRARRMPDAEGAGADPQ